MKNMRREHSNITRIIFFTFLAMALLLASCVRATPAPSINIKSPVNGATISSSNIVVSVMVDNFVLIDKSDQSSGGQIQGHIVYYLDVTPPTHFARTALTQRGTYNASADTYYTWENVTPGMHLLGVQLVTNDNMPLNVPVTTTINVNVTLPSLSPSSSGKPAGTSSLALFQTTTDANPDIKTNISVVKPLRRN